MSDRPNVRRHEHEWHRWQEIEWCGVCAAERPWVASGPTSPSARRKAMPKSQKPVPVPQKAPRTPHCAPQVVPVEYREARYREPQGDLWFCEPCEGWHDRKTSRRLSAAFHSEVWRYVS